MIAYSVTSLNRGSKNVFKGFYQPLKLVKPFEKRVP